MPEDAGVKSSLAKRLLSNAVWAFGAKSIGMTSGLITSALLARLLSTEDMGAYFLVASISAFAALVACFGMRQTIVRLVSESLALGLPGRARGTIKIVFSTIAIGCLLVSSAYVLGVGEWLARELFHLPILASITVATGIWIIVQSFQMPVTEIFRGMHKIRHAVLLDGGLVSFFLATALTAVWIADVKLSLEEAVLISALVSLGVLLLGVESCGTRDDELESMGRRGLPICSRSGAFRGSLEACDVGCSPSGTDEHDHPTCDSGSVYERRIGTVTECLKGYGDARGASGFDGISRVHGRRATDSFRGLR
jgi:hypothetical protein